MKDNVIPFKPRPGLSLWRYRWVDGYITYVYVTPKPISDATMDTHLAAIAAHGAYIVIAQRLVQGAV
jgi:hypothetical protein